MHVPFKYLSIIKANKKLTWRFVIGNNLQIHNKAKDIPKLHLWLTHQNITELFDDEIIQTSHMRQNNFLIHLKFCHIMFKSFNVKS
jgi:hypothetical protein